jgi:hypothetical protein
MDERTTMLEPRCTPSSMIGNALRVLLVGSLLCAGCMSSGDAPEDGNDLGSVNAAASSDALVVSTALKLSSTAPKPGDTITASVTYRNPGTKSVSVKTIVIAGRPPGGTNGGGPYKDFAPAKGALTLAAGGSVTVSGTLALAKTDPTGTWYAYSTYEDANGAWHDGAKVNFQVATTTTTPPPTTSACASLAVSAQRGVNFIEGPIQTVNSQNPGYATELAEIKKAGFNVVRAVMDWGAYDANPTSFLAGLTSLATAADQTGLCVLYDNHQWSTSQQYGGDGFPSSLTKNYSAQQAFWAAYFNNAISLNGTSIWDLQAAYMQKVVSTVDSHASTMAYEILNEPRVDTCDQFAKLGAMYTSIGTRIRTLTSKAIHIDRAANFGCTDWNDPALEVEIKPQGVSNLVFHPHIYAPSTPLTQTCGPKGCQPELNYEVSLGQALGAPVYVGEWGQLSGGETQAIVNTYMTAMKNAGVGWSYWCWDPVWQYSMNSSSYGNTSYFTYVTTGLANIH